MSRAEILPIIADIINNPVTGSNFATATANSPGPGQLTLVAETTGVPFTTAVSFSAGASGGLVGAPIITVPNQTLNYEYYWRRSDAAGVPLTIPLDVTDSSTYETNTSNGGLTLNVVNVSATQYYIVTVIANNCEVNSDVMSLTSPTEVDLSISSICPDEITAVATGGSGAYLYELFDRFGTQIDTSGFASPGPFTFGPGITLIGGFQYTVIATDTNGCGGSSTAVDINTPVDLSIDESTITVTPADCNGNGSITIDQGGTTITGGSTAWGDLDNLVFEWTGLQD